MIIELLNKIETRLKALEIQAIEKQKRMKYFNDSGDEMIFISGKIEAYREVLELLEFLTRSH